MSFYIMQMKGFVGIDGMAVLKRCYEEWRGGNVDRRRAEGSGIMRGMREQSRW
jgi:hypothetical protein